MSKYLQGGNFLDPLVKVVSRPEKDELAGFDWDAVEESQRQHDEENLADDGFICDTCYDLDEKGVASPLRMATHACLTCNPLDAPQLNPVDDLHLCEEHLAEHVREYGPSHKIVRLKDA